MGESGARQSHLGSVGVSGGSLLSAHTAWTQSWKEAPEEPEPPEDVRISVELLDSLDSDDPGKHGDYSPNILVATLPLVGRIHLLKHKVGFVTVGFIVLYWIYGTWSTICVILKPHYDDGEISGILILYYMVVSALCIAALFRAVTSNPGRIPFSHEPPVSLENLTSLHCAECKRRRPQRSHHCRRCGQCILRMDHHCPWINNCVGQENHWAFMQLLWYAFLMSVSTFAFCMCHIYYWPPCRSCDKDMTTIDWMKLQHRLTERGGMIVRDDVPKATKSCLQAHQDLCGGGSRLMWPFPCRRRRGPLYVSYPQIV